MTVEPIEDDELHAFLDGELPPERQAQVADWLAQHPEEQARLDAWRAQAEAIRAAYDPILAEPLPPRLAALREDRRGARPRLSLWAASVAAALVVFGSGFATARFIQPPDSARQESLADYGIEAHAVYVGEVRHPVEVTADEEDHLVRWLSRRLDAPLAAPNLADMGLTLVGGRLLPAGGKPCAMLMYEAPSGERFTLLVTSGNAAGETSFRYQQGDGYGAFHWTSGALSYVVVGPEERARLLGVSRRVYEQLS